MTGCGLSSDKIMLKANSVKSKLLVVLGSLIAAWGIMAQSSTFTYQGQLSAGGTPANGLFDLRFTLHNAAASGTQVAGPLTNAPVGVTNGLFTTELNFGSSTFDGNPRWLEIGVRPNGSAQAFTTLTPRQALNATPYAIRAANFAGTLAATNLTGKISDTNLSANVALLNTSAPFSSSVSAPNFIGNGINLTNLSATNLVGVLADARLSTNVAFLNTSNAIFKGGISATNFYGFGGGLTNVPGRIFNFVPTTTSLTADDNYGYLAQNDSTPVVITLPPTAEFPVGNIVRVSGSGAAGWIIAQNAGQRILVANLLKVTGAAWQSVPGSISPWRATAASGDGQKLVALPTSGQIFVSTTYGSNWTASNPSLNWNATAVSGNGNYLFAAPASGAIHYSANGGGWTSSASGSANWSSIATSVNGQFVVASVLSGFLYRSVNFGVNWTPMLNTAATWTGIASSGNGVYLAACATGNNIWVSTNSGANGSWTARGPNKLWSCIAASADGGTMIAGVNNSTTDQLYVSYDFGQSWIPTGPTQPWTSVSCSADGLRMIASYGGAGGGVYVSQDAGATWQLRGNLTSADFRGVAVSGDGSTAVALGTATPIYVSSQTSTTVGTAGQLIGSRLSAVELQHVGNGVFMPISSVGTIRAK